MTGVTIEKQLTSNGQYLGKRGTYIFNVKLVYIGITSDEISFSGGTLINPLRSKRGLSRLRLINKLNKYVTTVLNEDFR